MALAKSAVAIDLGSTAIKVVDVRVGERGVHVLGALAVPRAELEAEGVDFADKAALARAIRQKMAEARISPRGVVLGIGGQDCMLRYTRIPPVPAWRLKVIMDYEAGEVAEKVGEPLASDYRPLELPREAEEDQPILLGLVKEKPLGELLEAFEAAGITVEKAVPTPLALFGAHEVFGQKSADDAPEDDLLLLLDLGGENLCVALAYNNRLAFARAATFGGKNFTEALASALGADFAKAEEVKAARGGLDERERGVLLDTTAPLRSAGGQLLGLVQSSLRFASSQTGVKLPAVTRIVAAGGGMRLRGLSAFLAQGLGKPVDPFEAQGLQVSEAVPEDVAEVLTERPGEFAAALGLATSKIREAGGVKAALNILPQKYVKRREFKDRTLFLYVAAALLVLLLTARLVHAIVESSSTRKVHADLTAAYASLKAKKDELDVSRRESDKRKARLNRLLEESEQTAFQAFVLDLLSRVLRPEIQLDKVYMDMPVTESDTGYDYNLRVAGRVNNEKRQGLEWILDLQATLKSEERIAQVEVESSRPEGPWYLFELSLKPNYVSY